MVIVARYSFILGAVLVFGSAVQATSLPISRHDRTTQSWGDSTNYGPRQHYVHTVRGTDGQPKDIYRYYLDAHGRPVLDGRREVRQWKHDPGHMFLYRDGRVIKEWDTIVTG
jgi:hypothetical protein